MPIQAGAPAARQGTGRSGTAERHLPRPGPRTIHLICRLDAASTLDPPKDRRAGRAAVPGGQRKASSRVTTRRRATCCCCCTRHQGLAHCPSCASPARRVSGARGLSAVGWAEGCATAQSCVFNCPRSVWIWRHRRFGLTWVCGRPIPVAWAPSIPVQARKLTPSFLNFRWPQRSAGRSQQGRIAATTIARAVRWEQRH